MPAKFTGHVECIHSQCLFFSNSINNRCHFRLRRIDNNLHNPTRDVKLSVECYCWGAYPRRWRFHRQHCHCFMAKFRSADGFCQLPDNSGMHGNNTHGPSRHCQAKTLCYQCTKEFHHLLKHQDHNSVSIQHVPDNIFLDYRSCFGRYFRI